MTNLEPRKEKDKDQCNEKYGQTMRVHDCLPQLDHQEQDGTLSTAQHWPMVQLQKSPRKLEDSMTEFARRKNASAGDGDARAGFSPIFDVADRRRRRRSQLGHDTELSRCC